MINEKGGLIKKKKKKPILKPAVQVKKIQNEDFGYKPKDNIIKKDKKTVEKIAKRSEPSTKTKTNRKKHKSIKVPEDIYNEINLLGSFMNENILYQIVQNTIDSYVKNELTDRQQRQFEFMVEEIEDKI